MSGMHNRSKLPYVISFSNDGGKKWTSLCRWTTEGRAREELALFRRVANPGITYCLDEVDEDDLLVREIDAV